MTTLNVKSKELEGQTVRKKIQVTLIQSKQRKKKKNTGSAKCTCNLQKQKTKTTLNI